MKRRSSQIGILLVIPLGVGALFSGLGLYYMLQLWPETRVASILLVSGWWLFAFSQWVQVFLQWRQLRETRREDRDDSINETDAVAGATVKPSATGSE